MRSTHIRFLKETAEQEDECASVGLDKTVLKLKNRPSRYYQNERKYMPKSIKFVKQVFIGPDSGILNFASLIDTVQPYICFVN